MIKKIAFTIIALLSIITASAEGGSWKIHPVFGATPANAIDVGDRIFYLVSNNLFCYDKETSENGVYDKSNYLNDTQVRNIYYNYDKKYLVVVYSNSNIDIILNDGKVINLPDITNSLLPSAKTVNHVTFSGNRIYVATAFGYVAIDDEKFEVAESRIYNKNLTSVAVCGDYILLGSASGTYIGLASKAHSTLDSYVLSATVTNGKFLSLTDNKFLTYGTNAVIYEVAAGDDGTPTGLTLVKSLNGSAPQAVQPVKSLNKYMYMVLYTATPSYYTIDPTTAEASAAITLPTAVKSELLTSQETSTGEWWAVGSNGIRKVSIDGTTATASEYQKINATTVSRVFFLTYNQEKGYLLAANTGPTIVSNEGGAAIIDCLEGGNWTNFNPTITTGGKSSATKLWRSYEPIVDPTNSNAFIIGTRDQGLLRFVNFEEANHWDQDNSQIKAAGSRCNTHAVDFDKYGNLWYISGTETPTKVYVLPHDKIETANSVNDWVDTGISTNSSWGNTFYIARKSGVKAFSVGGDGPFKFFKEVNEGDYTTFKFVEFNFDNSVLDQDNNYYNFSELFCFKEDNNGKIWLGTANGICIWDTDKLFDVDYRVTRPKVPRNDGTNNADYLLTGIRVNAIAVDDLNRKWIGTNADGLYLVSADGSEVIEQFNTSNSVLPTNQIFSVCCIPNSNTVFVGTPSGVLEYESSSVSPAPTYDDVLVYPNPVRPEYTGAITIKGLMDNSLIKISDASGNVITSLQSSGGVATWDGLNASGERVKSGVYFVLASENENETSSAIVAKFLVIR